MPAPETPLEDLKRRLEAATVEKSRSEKPLTEAHSGIALAARMSVELVASICVGAVLGYYLDAYFSSSPWGLAIGFLLGCVAGFRNLIRTGERLDKQDDCATTPPQ